MALVFPRSGGDRHMPTRGEFQRAPDRPVILGPDGKPWQRDPAYGDMALPHVLTYASILSGAYHTYYHQRWDEAYRHAREDALAMRRDCFISGPYEERLRALTMRPWHLDVPNEKDPIQKGVRDAITRQLESVKEFRRLLWSLAEAIWYGRYGVQVKWHWNTDAQARRRVLGVKKWEPVNGDKIGHQHDGTPYILIYGAGDDQLPPDTETIYTTVTRAIPLRGWWRQQFILHKHLIEDADFFDVEASEARGGVGIRSKIFWLNWLRLEYASWVSDFLERVGLGITVWYYELGNPQAKAAVEQAAEDQSGRVNITLPRSPTDRTGASGIERIETPASGAQVLQALQEPLRADIQRYIIGQTLSSSSEGSGLGGSGVADLHEDTKRAIALQDCEFLAETLTGDEADPGLVWMIQAHSFPETLPGPNNPNGFRVRFAFDVERAESKDKLEAIGKVISFGVDVKEDEVRSAAGLSKPEIGDAIVKGQKPQQPGGMPGMPGAPGQPGQDGRAAGEGGQAPSDGTTGGLFHRRKDGTPDKRYRDQRGMGQGGMVTPGGQPDGSPDENDPTTNGAESGQPGASQGPGQADDGRGALQAFLAAMAEDGLDSPDGDQGDAQPSPGGEEDDEDLSAFMAAVKKAGVA